MCGEGVLAPPWGGVGHAPGSSGQSPRFPRLSPRHMLVTAGQAAPHSFAAPALTTTPSRSRRCPVIIVGEGTLVVALVGYALACQLFELFVDRCALWSPWWGT